MKAQQVSAGVFRLSHVPALDPMLIVLHDVEIGKGHLIVTCFGRAWTAYWNAMGDRTVRDFVGQCDVDYLVNSLAVHPCKRADIKYLNRIVEAVKEWLTVPVCTNCDTPYPPGCNGLFVDEPDGVCLARK